MKYALLLALISCISFVGCDYTPTSYTPPLPLKYTYDNPRQNEFDSIVSYYYQQRETLRGKVNELVMDSLLNEYTLTLLDFFENPLVENWSYFIKGLKIRDTKENGKRLKEITFDLVNVTKENKYPAIEFDAVYVVPEDSLDTNRTYNVLKSSKNNDRVNFSAIVARNRKEKSIFHNFGSNDAPFFIPRFNVIILEVTKYETKETEKD